MKKIISEKSDNELDEIISDYKDVFNDVLEALSVELKKRNYRTEKLKEIEAEKDKRIEINNRVKTTKLKKKVAFNWTPKYSDNIETKLPEKLAVKCIYRAMNAIWWDIVYYEENDIEAKRKDDWNKWTEKISVKVEQGVINITSKSLKNDFCDFGRNSKRVEELKLAFKILENEYDAIEIAKELEGFSKKEEENKYQIPETLSKPPEQKEKKAVFLFVGGALTSLILGGILALFSSLIYVIFLYDFVIGLLTAISFGYLIRLSNISDFDKIKWIGFGSIGLTYILSHIFRFMYIVSQNNIENASILDYLIAKLNSGLQFKDLNLGWIGLIVAWIIEVGIAILFYYLRVAQKVIVYDLENAPQDVVDFAIYLFNEEKDEDAVRIELTKKGWCEKEQQDLIFKAIGAEISRQDLVRAD